MKNLIMSFSLCLIAILFTTDLRAQNYWKGGTPGNETNWNIAKNWSQNQVPDWSEDVIIPDVSSQSGYFPVITQVIDAIPHLVIHSSAIVTVVERGRLVIDGQSTFNCGILLNGKLISHDEIDIVNVGQADIDQQKGELFIINAGLAVK
jgi:hypothetical protein